ncbi:MAG: FAD/NAD(P)-binding oxidoreductase [Actinomycetota bacterium]|nr:FAD/NAD(P)-binding oxidoreductase [Actinomycetota bacterium]
MTEKTICVLGGGIGGVAVANRLKSALGDAGRVVIIDKSPDHVFAPSFLSVLTGDRRPADIKRPLAGLSRKGIEFINAEVKAIKPEESLILAGDEQIRYDYLIVALGARANLAAVEGLADAAINLYSLDGILKLKERIETFGGGEVVILIPSMPYKCPAAPYEAAFMLDAAFRRRGLREKANISVYTVEPLPMPTAGPQVGQAIKGMLAGRKIDFKPQMTIKSVSAGKELVFADGTTKRADLLVTIPPHKAPDVVKAAGLTNEAGWIPVDPKTLKTKFDNVFALGDVTAVKLAGQYKPDKPLMLPKAGVFAHAEAEIVAANIVADITGRGTRREFDGHGSCFLELGDGTAGYSKGDFFALPHPEVSMKGPARRFRLYKILFEKWWFWRSF